MTGLTTAGRLLHSRSIYSLLAGAAALAAIATVPAFAVAKADPVCVGNVDDGPPPGWHDMTGQATNGDDHIMGTNGDDWVYLKDGDDTFHGNGGDDIAIGGAGGDTVIGGAGEDSLRGSDGRDLLIGDHAVINGSGTIENDPVNHDCVAGYNDPDTVVGDNYSANGLAESGNDGSDPDGGDVVEGLGDTDLIVGDNMAVGAGHDAGSVLGTGDGWGEDFVAGADNDTGGPVDVIVGDNYSRNGSAYGGGTDSVNGGPGPDLAIGDNYAENGVGEVASGGWDENGTFTLCCQGQGYPFTIADNTFTRNGGIHLQQNMDTGYGDNLAPNGTASGNGTDNNDVIGGYDGSDTLVGGPGNDYLTGDCLQDAPAGRSYQDCADAGRNDTIQGGPGNDNMYGYWKNGDSCDGGSGTDTADTTQMNTYLPGWDPTDDSCDTVLNVP